MRAVKWFLGLAFAAVVVASINTGGLSGFEPDPVYVSSYADAWSADVDTFDQPINEQFWTVSITEADEPWIVQSYNSIYHPNGALIEYGTRADYYYVRVDKADNENPESAPDGEYGFDSRHFLHGYGWVNAFWIPVRVTPYWTRYRYVGIDYYMGTNYWLYDAALCGNRCQKAGWRTPADPRFPIPPPYLQGVGSRTSIFGFGWCRIRHLPVSQFDGTKCYPQY